LKQWPDRWRPGSEEGTLEILFPRMPYVTVYRVTEKVIEVLQIYHSHKYAR
jgi:hypothetical protein